MIIRWHATASIELELDGQKLLFDPFIPLPGSETCIDISEYDGYDTVFVTHGHFDHILNLPEICNRNPAMTIYCSKTPYSTLRHNGVPANNLKQITFDQELIHGNFTVRTYHGRHAILPKTSPHQISRVLKRGMLKNLLYLGRINRRYPEHDETILYEIHGGGKTIVIMGSLNLREEINYPTDCDALILPYNGWEDNFPPAVAVIERLKPKHIYLDHYDDTFPPLTDYVDLSPILQKYDNQIQALAYKRDIII